MRLIAIAVLASCATTPDVCPTKRASCDTAGRDGVCEPDVTGELTCYALCAALPDPCGPGGASANDNGTCYCVDQE